MNISHFLFHSTFDKHVECMPCVAIRNSAARSICIHVFWWIDLCMHFCCVYSRSAIAEILWTLHCHSSNMNVQIYTPTSYAPGPANLLPLYSLSLPFSRLPYLISPFSPLSLFLHSAGCATMWLRNGTFLRRIRSRQGPVSEYWLSWRRSELEV